MPGKYEDNKLKKTFLNESVVCNLLPQEHQQTTGNSGTARKIEIYIDTLLAIMLGKLSPILKSQVFSPLFSSC